MANGGTPSDGSLTLVVPSPQACKPPVGSESLELAEPAPKKPKQDSGPGPSEEIVDGQSPAPSGSKPPNRLVALGGMTARQAGVAFQELV